MRINLIFFFYKKFIHKGKFDNWYRAYVKLARWTSHTINMISSFDKCSFIIQHLWPSKNYLLFIIH